MRVLWYLKNLVTRVIVRLKEDHEMALVYVWFESSGVLTYSWIEN